MRLQLFRRITASILAALLILAAPGISAAETLAGNKGDIRFYPYLPGNPKDPCTKAYNAYVAASGHSAYATTLYSRVVDLSIICGVRMNAPSQKAAEDLALQNCQAGMKRWKVKLASGGCQIALSK